MSTNVLLMSAIILGVCALVVWKYRVEVLDFLCGHTPPAPTLEIKEALKNDALILDVRMRIETHKKGANLIPEAKNIPLIFFVFKVKELPKDRTIITFCESGKRAGKAADMLNSRGYKALSGGGILNVQKIQKEMKSLQ